MLEAQQPTTVKKQNYSKKRQAILETLQSTHCHPTAEWIYQKLKPDFPTLSLGTVYRNLAQFKADGLIIGISNREGQECFDATVTAHSHFICKACGKVRDVLCDPIQSETEQSIASMLGATIDSHDLRFFGICKDCAVE